ncbi:type II secretion system F family protein [Paradesertivirga mongoliensis]|uniref:General secretion pathway protein F n=1 Tax=Paradesertivirga mongoliensis TaxID=2100740 RepID=A0ABW4ZK72_9SPHI|nr:type II secretion system F family protein [Pedobacter mongoliensis]
MPSIDLSSYKSPKKKKPVSGNAFSWAEVLNKEISFGKPQVPDRKKEAFYLELSTLLLSGIDLKTALELILVDQDKAKDKVFFTEIKDKVLTGSPLSEAIRSTGKFSDYDFYSIRIGEETGRIGEVLTNLAKYFKSKISQRRKVISAVTYPAIVLTTSMGAVFFMLKFVVPMFADVFQRFGGELPFITALILKVSGWFDQFFLYGLAGLCLLIGFVVMSRTKPWFRQLSSALILRLPVIGEIVRKIYLARFANTMRLLVSTDTPLLRSIALVRQMIGFYPIELSLAEVEQSILKGESLHKSLSKFSFYPPKLVQLIKVGEEVNRLDYFFEKIANQYTEEVEYRTGTISSFLEPLIIIFLGLVVGVILIAMYLPMFQMSNGF